MGINISYKLKKKQLTERIKLFNHIKILKMVQSRPAWGSNPIPTVLKSIILLLSHSVGLFF